MQDDSLRFRVEREETLLKTPIFDLVQRVSISPEGHQASFVVAKAPDWVNVIAEVDDQKRACFLMVRQFRHGDGQLYWEFPGGMVDEGETPEQAAQRELHEETGFEAREWRLLGSCNSNPAFLTNRVWTFLARGAQRVNTALELDQHEYLSVGLLPIQDVRRRLSESESHGIMSLALLWWERQKYGYPQEGLG